MGSVLANYFSLPSGLKFRITDLPGDDEKVSLTRVDGGEWTRNEKAEVLDFFNAKMEQLRERIFDWRLCQNEVKFTATWFRRAQQNAQRVLAAVAVIGIDGLKSKDGALQGQKRIAAAIFQRCDAGLAALKKKKNADRQGAEVLHLIHALISEPDRQRGAKLARSAKERGNEIALSSAPTHGAWQRQADEIRRRSGSPGGSAAL
ncbi:MAG TPA: hypothetical protein VLA17_15970, partial [Candidatus Limnocylindria bacterium]|nr:hypothetical protein [Candidatus Limnocylindria bacterium]